LGIGPILNILLGREKLLEKVVQNPILTPQAGFQRKIPVVIFKIRCNFDFQI
jgi:hypothetical protein